MDDRAVIYVDLVCPYCGVDFPEPPGSTGKCPSCGQRVIRDRDAIDDLVRLIQDGQQSEASAEARERAKQRQYYDKDPGPMRKLNATKLRTYAALGIHVVTLNQGQDRIVDFAALGTEVKPPRATAECKPCRGLNRTTYPANRAPILPLDGCTSRPNLICTCRYQPFIPEV